MKNKGKNIDSVDRKYNKFQIRWWINNIRNKFIFQDTYHIILNNLLLFVGVVLTAWSILSFDHSRYCDGTIADHYSCVNSATFYEYSVSTIFVFVLGAVSIAFWYIKRNTTIING